MTEYSHRFPIVDLGQDSASAMLEAYRRDRVPPLLFTGPEGSAKEVMAIDFARKLSCGREPVCRVDGDLCEECRQALLLEHPGIHLVYPTPTQGSAEKPGDDEVDIAKVLEEKRLDIFSEYAFTKKASLRVARSRAIIQRAGSRPFNGRYNVFIIVDAHAMREEAQNAVLKLVEEPPASCVMILITPQPDAILYTIRSRCQRVRFVPLKIDVVDSLLQEYYGVPAGVARRAADLSQGSIRRARVLAAEHDDDERAAAHDIIARIATAPRSWLLGQATAVSRGGSRDRVARFLHEMAVACRDMMAGDEALFINRDRAAELQANAAQWTPKQLAAVLQRVVEARDEVLRRNLNAEATLADLFLDIQRSR